jgi:hypothetical protein
MMTADEICDAKTGRSNAQRGMTRILMRRRQGGQDGLEGRNEMLLRKLLKRRGERKMKRDANGDVDKRKRPRLAVKKRRTPGALRDVQRVREKRLTVKLLRLKKPNVLKGVAPGKPPSERLMLSPDHLIVDDLTWILMTTKSDAEDVKNDVPHVMAMPQEPADASRLLLSTTTYQPMAQSTRTGRKMRRGRRLAGHTQELIRGFKTILTRRHHLTMLHLSMIRRPMTRRGAAEGSHVATQNMMMLRRMIKKSVEEDASPGAPSETR